MTTKMTLMRMATMTKTAMTMMMLIKFTKAKEKLRRKKSSNHLRLKPLNLAMVHVYNCNAFGAAAFCIWLIGFCSPFIVWWYFIFLSLDFKLKFHQKQFCLSFLKCWYNKQCCVLEQSHWAVSFIWKQLACCPFKINQYYVLLLVIVISQ